MINKKILIVEDEIVTAKSYAVELRHLGFDICTFAVSGEAAIEAAEKEGPDLVIMDIGLKGAIDGIEAGRHIKDRFNIPVIYITGYPDDETRQAAGIISPHEYLIKPVQRKELRASIESVLRADHTILAES